MSECQKCGECCRRIMIGTDLPDELAELMAVHFGRPINRIGMEIEHRCRNLGDDNLCMDYHNRPDYCRKFMCNNPGALMVKVKM